MAFEYNLTFLRKMSKGNSSVTMASWPSSTPILKANTFITKLPEWALRSPNTLANPIPWSRPNPKVINPKRMMIGYTLLSAVIATDIAMPSSTIRLLSVIKSSAVAVNVIECANVNVLTNITVLFIMCLLLYQNVKMQKRMMLIKMNI